MKRLRVQRNKKINTFDEAFDHLQNRLERQNDTVWGLPQLATFKEMFELDMAVLTEGLQERFHIPEIIEFKCGPANVTPHLYRNPECPCELVMYFNWIYPKVFGRIWENVKKSSRFISDSLFTYDSEQNTKAKYDVRLCIFPDFYEYSFKFRPQSHQGVTLRLVV